MQDFTEISYTVDPEDRIVEVSPEWTTFATANDGQNLDAESIVGRSLWGFIADEATRELYGAILDRVRQGAETCLVLRCDAPGRRRLIDLTVARLPNQNVRFKTTLLASKDRPVQRLFAHTTPRSTSRLMVCSWCNRVHVREEDEWLEVEPAMEHLNLHGEAELPEIDPMVCPSCFAKVLETVAQSPLAPR